MDKRFEGLVNFGFVTYEGVFIPRRIRVTLSDLKGPPGGRQPTVSIVYEIREARVKCISLSAESLEDNKSIERAIFSDLDIKALGEEAIATLSMQQKAGTDDQLEIAEIARGRRAAKALSDGLYELSRRELMHIGLHYSNPNNAKAPTQAVLRMMGYGSRDTAIRRIANAREKGWVLPADSTREQITEHYLAVLKELNGQKNDN